MATTDAFRAELKAQLDRAARRGAPHVEINAGELHRTLGGYPGPSHRMPTCCAAMYAETTDGDVIVTEPAEGKGASLTIRYRLPRRTAR
jgi:5-methylcytosine-specific restriction protein A